MAGGIKGGAWASDFARSHMLHIVVFTTKTHKTVLSFNCVLLCCIGWLGWRTKGNCEGRIYALGFTVPGYEESQYWAKLSQPLFKLPWHAEEPWI